MPTSSKPKPFSLGLIGGSGLYALSGFSDASSLEITTPYSASKIQLQQYQCDNVRVVFLPRHGSRHQLAPHLINYQANMWALKHAAVDCVIAINTVGGITQQMQPGVLCLPEQLIDYTWGRASSYCEGPADAIPHVDFTRPFDALLRIILTDAAHRSGQALLPYGVYGCTQGPRLETAAEIIRLGRDGCDIVGMTGMPEAILARELALPYCMLALVVNRGAGLTGEPLDFSQIKHFASKGLENIQQLLRDSLDLLALHESNQTAVLNTGD